MITAIPASRPVGAALWIRQARRLMDVILHLGAHRTATTTFQHYTQDQVEDLSARGIAYWGPRQTRKSVFPGLFRNSTARKGRNVARRAEGRAKMFLQQAEARNVAKLLVSDENLLGTCNDNIRAASLYPGAGERVARIASAFSGNLRRILLTLRAQDLWWASACALTVSRGHPVPDAGRLERISLSRRSWRDVITDIACAAPDAVIEVLPFESYAGRPDRVLSAALDIYAMPDPKQRWLNRSQDLRTLRKGLAEQGSTIDLLPNATGRWQPFSPEQAARLRENYADDLHWLIAGADGLARLTEDNSPKRAGTSLPPGFMTKGQGHDKGQLAQDG